MKGININVNRKTLYMVFGIILVSVLSLTIVYAALSVTLNIVGNAEVVASSWDIHLANPKVKSGSVSTIVPQISGNDLSFSASLTTPGDYYEFTVDVVNDGTIDAMIDIVVKTPELTTEQAKYFKYEVSYENGESINTKQTIKKGTTTPIKVRIEYRNDLVASDLPTTTTNLSLKLTLIYVQSDGSGNEIPNNGVVDRLVKVVNGDYDTVGSEICVKDECFYVISSTSDTVTMLAKYNLFVGSKYNNGVLTEYGSEATGKQDSTMLGLNYIDVRIRNGISDFSDSHYWLNESYIKDGKWTNIYVMDSNSKIYDYVKNYESILESYELDVIDSRLISYDELVSLGCDGENNTCVNAPSFVYATSYWTGSVDALAYEYIWGVLIDGHFHCDEDYFGHNGIFGVRPVITIPKSEFLKELN